MRLRLISALALSGGATAAFTSNMPTFGGTSVTTGSAKNIALQRFMSSEKTTVCDMPDVDPTDLMSQKGSAQVLRKAMLTNAAGELIPLGESMGQGSSLVVFLRHLG
jgi:hypothetical protein